MNKSLEEVYDMIHESQTMGLDSFWIIIDSSNRINGLPSRKLYLRKSEADDDCTTINKHSSSKCKVVNLDAWYLNLAQHF